MRKLSLFDSQWLKSIRRYVMVINLILGALLTTPEIITQVLMALVLQALFEMVVVAAWYRDRLEKRREAVGH